MFCTRTLKNRNGYACGTILSTSIHQRLHMLQIYWSILAAHIRLRFSIRDDDVKFNRKTSNGGKGRQQGQHYEGQSMLSHGSPDFLCLYTQQEE